MSKSGEEAIADAVANNTVPNVERRKSAGERHPDDVRESAQGIFDGEERRGAVWEESGAPGAMKVTPGKPSL